MENRTGQRAREEVEGVPGIFITELVFAAVIPFIIVWVLTPTSVLNSSAVFGAIGMVGGIGGAVLLIGGIPIGITGIKTARGMDRMRWATKVLSIVNLTAGMIEIVILIFIFCAVIFGGVAV